MEFFGYLQTLENDDYESGRLKKENSIFIFE